MQIPFYTENDTIEFSKKNEEIFPPSPDKCPFKDCAVPVKLDRHGYYDRFFISKKFTGVLYIRRYICPICGRTVSMLPYFCISNFQYSALDILNILYELYHSGISLEKLIRKTNETLPFIQRRHINFYRRRIIRNRKLIQYVLNLILLNLIIFSYQYALFHRFGSHIDTPIFLLKPLYYQGLQSFYKTKNNDPLFSVII